jgi:uncharacterized metal-binding protein
MAVAYLDGSNPLMPDLDLIGNPITKDVLARFDRLRAWLWFPPQILERPQRRPSAA